MITSQVIAQVLAFVKGKLPGRNLFDHAVYDSEAAFEPRGRELVIGKDAAQKRVQGNPNWLLLMWTRQALGGAPEQGRQFMGKVGKYDRNLPQYDAKVYDVRLASLPFKGIFYSPSMMRLEELEENLLMYRWDGPVLVDYPDIVSGVEAVMSDFTVGALSKMSVDQYGSLTTIQVDMKLTYPVFYGKGSVKLIKTPILDIYTSVMVG